MTTRQIKNINRKVANAAENQLASFLTDQENIAKLISFLASLGLTLTMGDTNMIFPVLTGATGYALTASVAKALKDTRDFSTEYHRQLIRETDEYYYCSEIYESIITDLANFIRDFNFKNSLEIGMFYQDLLYSGFLSAPGYFKYQKYKHDDGVCPEIYGARVSSGTGVCRHIAANLRDIYEKLGFTASYLSVHGSKNNLISNIRTRIMPSSINHAVVCVKDSFGKYIIDPTWEKVAIFDSDEKFAHIIGDKSKDRRYVIGYTTLLCERRLVSYDSYVDVRKAPRANFAGRDVAIAHDRALDAFLQERTAVVQFYNYIIRRLENLCYYEQQISRYSNNEDKSQKLVLK